MQYRLEWSFSTSAANSVNKTVTQPSDKIEEILAYLRRIGESNQSLARRVDSLEEQKSLAGTPQRSRSHTQVTETDLASHGFPLQQDRRIWHSTRSRDMQVDSSLNPSNGLQIPGVSTESQPGPQVSTQVTGVTSTKFLHHTDDRSKDSVLPNLDVLRHNPTVAQSVSCVLTSYEEQARQDVFEGKTQLPKCSGRYNSTDTISPPPPSPLELRWPNEGYHGSTSKKRTLYDDLTLSEWAVGQLTNVYLMKDSQTSKQALLQVILLLKDSTLLPWPAVRTAWAHSMHEVEQGMLGWDNSTQWSLNRLSASQIAMANSQVVTNSSVSKKVCKYYNEGSCSHESHHSNYKHSCCFCARHGRQLQHPEFKCNFKQKQQDRVFTKYEDLKPPGRQLYEHNIKFKCSEGGYLFMKMKLLV